MTKNTQKITKIGKKDEKVENELIKSIKKDEKLSENPDLKIEMISMATMFLEDFSENMYKTSIEMNSKIPFYTIDAWKNFLNYPLVRKYIKSFRDEKINMMADQGLAEGDKGAVSIKKAMQEGCERMIVILTRPRDEYREDRKDRIQSRLIQRRYPKAAEVFRMRAMRYNQALDELKELEKEGSALILAPRSIEGMKTLSFHQEAILHLYHEGKEQVEKIENFLNRQALNQ